MVRRYLVTLLLLLITSGSIFLLFNDHDRVKAEGPPYFPLQPCWFNVVDTYWGSSDARMNASPGDTNIPLIVTIQNISNSTVTGISQTLILQQPFTNMSGGELANSFYDESISPGSTSSTQFILNIDRYAAPGEYVLTMRISYLTVATGVGSTLYIARETEVKVPVLVTSTHYVVIYSVNILPREVQPTGNITVSGSLVDVATASSFYNTNVSISSPAFTRESFVFIGQVDPNIPRPFSALFQVKGRLSNGTYPVEILVTYQDTSNVIHVSSTIATFHIQEQTLTLPVRPSQTGEPIQILVNFLWSIFQFLFGSSTATLWNN